MFTNIFVNIYKIPGVDICAEYSLSIFVNIYKIPGVDICAEYSLSIFVNIYKIPGVDICAEYSLSIFVNIYIKYQEWTFVIPPRSTDYHKHTSLYMTPKTVICYTN
jgi:hypothetical protein